jgi:hypothetical protein
MRFLSLARHKDLTAPLPSITDKSLIFVRPPSIDVAPVKGELLLRFCHPVHTDRKRQRYQSKSSP